MRTTFARALVVTLVFGLVIGFSLAATHHLVDAQDATQEAGAMVSCDSDLILNLYVAERFFGFGALRDRMMAGGADTSTMVDLATINRGQFTPWFDAMTGMMDENMMMPGGMMTDEMMTNMQTMMMMDDAQLQETMQGMMPEGMDMSNMLLSRGVIAEEPVECSQLRADLTRFFTVLAMQDMSTGMTMGTGMMQEGAAALEEEMTSEATPEGTAPAGGDTGQASGPCIVTVQGDFTVNIRSGPGTDFDTVGTLTAGGTFEVTGQTLGADGIIWWQTSDGTWVRSDVVAEQGNCANAPTVSP
jgi:hypothetical protein